MRIAIPLVVCAVLGAVLGVVMARAQLGEPTIITLPDSAVTSASASSDIPTPRVAVDAETYDFGAIERHASQSHDFQFTNVGDAPLRLTVGDTSCKCTIGKAPDQLVQPGETVPVTLNWTAETDEHEFRQHATIHTNDPLRQSVSLTVVGRVIEASSYFPKYFHFDDITSGTSKSAEIVIVSFRDEEFEVTGTELVGLVSEDDFEVTVADLPAEDFPSPEVRSGRRVTLTAKPSLPFGPIRGELRIETTLDRAPQIDVPITGKVVSDFMIIGPGYDTEKDRLNLGAVVGANGAERKLYILLHGEQGAEAKLSVGEVSPDFLEVELGERGKVNDRTMRVPLVVRVPPGSPPAVHVGGLDSELGRIVIETTHPSVPQLEIGVRFTVE